MYKALFYLVVIIVVGYSQNKKTFFDQYILDRKLDTLNAILYTNKPTFEVMLNEELNNLKGYKPFSDSLKNEGDYLLFDEDISREEHMFKHFAQERVLSLKKRYPISMATIENTNRMRTILKIAGTNQILAGVAGTLITILDANEKETITVNKLNSTRKKGWNKTHTVATVLSGSMVFSGILIFCF